MILPDTNVWSVQSKPKVDQIVRDWLEAHMERFLLSTIVIAEIRAGIENPGAAHRRPVLTPWLTDIETKYQDRIVPFDTPAAHWFGTLVARRKLEKQETKLLDLQIAAQALSRGCAVATRNTRDFEWTGVKLIDPWQA